MIAAAALYFLMQTAPALENEYVKVSRNAAPCARAGAACGDRVFVALGPLDLSMGALVRKMARGDIAVFGPDRSYTAPAAGEYFEVAFKSPAPAVRVPRVAIAPEKNTTLHDGPKFFIFEEKLEPGETRARHSHSQRVVVVLNATRLQQWPDGASEVFRDQTPNDVHFNEPVTHVVRTVGQQALRNIVIELKPDRQQQ